jgi:hypothetical protein
MFSSSTPASGSTASLNETPDRILYTYLTVVSY